MEPIIEVKNLGKKYKITHQRGGYIALRDVLTNIMKKPAAFVKAKAMQAARLVKREDFWALRDVSFSVKRGEVIGIIGRNGAGKSTLLKILTGITPPTEGEVIMHGRVSSLLEVGTGFHPELTGRENIFLNGAILGMKKKETAAKFDEIVAFAGIEKFLDTPVKYYSSGMYVRLAFSVAAHMEPDILLVDEVLAVGDAEFQKKCLGKMEQVTRTDGRTILFVSHNMVAIQKLCPKTILLENGRVKMIGKTEEVIGYYSGANGSQMTETRWEKENAPCDDVAALRSARLVDENGNKIAFAMPNKKAGIEFTYEVLRGGLAPVPNIHVFASGGERAFMSHAAASEELGTVGKHKAIMWIPENLLNEGIYSAQVVLSTMMPLRIHFAQQDAVVFSVVEDIMNPQKLGFNQKIPGAVRPLLKWETSQV